VVCVEFLENLSPSIEVIIDNSPISIDGETVG